jgi:hypothetical protein
MKNLLHTVLVLAFFAGIQAELHQAKATDKSFDHYLSSLSSEIVDTLINNAKELPAAGLEPQPIFQANPSGVAVSSPSGKAPERRLNYESLTNSYLIGDSDDTSTTNHLSMLISQQKAMQNYRVVGSWLNDLENNLDDLRDAVNRRVTDLSTGLQRRNQLLGHYNYIGQGMGLPGNGFPTIPGAI